MPLPLPQSPQDLAQLQTPDQAEVGARPGPGLPFLRLGHDLGSVMHALHVALDPVLLAVERHVRLAGFDDVTVHVWVQHVRRAGVDADVLVCRT